MRATDDEHPGRGVLVVGAGFTGGETVRRLRTRGHHAVRLLSRRPHPELDALAEGGMVVGDARDPEVCARALDGCETVVWCAGTLVPSSSAADLATVDDVTPLVTMLRELAGRERPRLAFLSSGGTVYGRPDRLPVAETEPRKPLSVYAAVKVLAERWVQRFRDEGVDGTILRASNVYGPTQPARATQGVIARAMRCVLDGEPFPIMGSGDAIRDYLYVDDLVDVIEAWLDGTVQAPVLNVGSGVPTSLADLVKMIDVVVGGLPTTQLPARPSDLDCISLDISLLRSQLPDFEPTPLSLGLERTWRAVRATGAARRP